MERDREPLRLYGTESDRESLAWDAVHEQLAAAGTYWVVATANGFPHPRPVWCVWADDVLHLSIGSPVLTRAVFGDPRVTVHLDSGTDVVIVEGTATVEPDPPAAVVAAYDAKYEWSYSVGEYGPMTRVDPVAVLAWRSAGWAGRDGFSQVGRWRFTSSGSAGRRHRRGQRAPGGGPPLNTIGGALPPAPPPGPNTSRRF